VNFLRRKDTHMEKPFDVNDLEDEIAELVSPRALPAPQYAPPPRPSLPAYVEHGEDVDAVSRLTAEAVVQQHEATAKVVEEMGTDLRRYAGQLQELLAAVVTELKNVEMTAQSIRDRGKREFERVERSSVVISQVRTACEDMRKRIENPEA
jgi:hypothetical protein